MPGKLAFPIAMAAACGSPSRPSAPAVAGPFALDGTATLVGDDVSTAHSEIRFATSPDGKLRLWGSTDRAGGPGGWDIWQSRATDGGWSAPEPAAFDSPANDFDPAFSADGKYVYFFSNRPGGAGGDDIYRAPLTAGGFGAVEHLGPEINTEGNEWAPSPALDGGGLLFATNRPPGKHDLYFAAARGSGFAPAEALPGALNTPDHDEFDATYLADGTSIVFSRSTDVENDPIALFVSRRGPAGYDAGTRLPDTVNVDGGYTLGPSIDLHDRQVLYFSSKRAEAGAGKLDIYRIRYR
jgi:Tol biopolymer transport system component